MTVFGNVEDFDISVFQHHMGVFSEIKRKTDINEQMACRVLDVTSARNAWASKSGDTVTVDGQSEVPIPYC